MAVVGALIFGEVGDVVLSGMEELTPVVCKGAEMVCLAISREDGDAVGEVPPIPKSLVDNRLLPVEVRGAGRPSLASLSRSVPL